MNETIQLLFDEHSIIADAIDSAKQARSLIGKSDDLYDNTVRNLIYFFREYADKYHHYKEEEILFPEMGKKNELLAEGVIKEMFENHEDFREKIRGIENLLEQKNYPDAQSNLESYTEALLDHIAVENDEVFQMAETIFNDNELENLKFRFADCDRELGDKKKKELAELAHSLRKQLIMTE